LTIRSSGIVLSTLPSFLDDFLVNVFYPSLEDTIRDLFNQTIADLDSFHENPDWPSLSRKPVMKGTTAFLDLITAFCKMLDTIPPDQQFGQLTIDLLTTYYDRCFEWYKELIARHQSDETKSDVKASAKWAQHEPVRQTIAAAWNSDESSDVPLLLQNVRLKMLPFSVTFLNFT
jgi:exocyst complex component 4